MLPQLNIDARTLTDLSKITLATVWEALNTSQTVKCDVCDGINSELS